MLYSKRKKSLAERIETITKTKEQEEKESYYTQKGDTDTYSIQTQI